jgi:hypothetical protein
LKVYPGASAGLILRANGDFVPPESANFAIRQPGTNITGLY